MNILVIGNGFDLAHGLPTKYTDFLGFCEAINKIYNVNIGLLPDSEAIWNEMNISEVNRCTDFEEWFRRIYKIRKICTKYGKRSISINKNMDEFHEYISSHLGYNLWIKFFLNNFKYINENWIDFESEVSKVVISLDKDMHNFELDDQIKNLTNNFLREIFVNESRDCVTFRYIRECLLDDLNNLIGALRIYLAEYVEKLEITKKSKDIELIRPSYVVSFNYTNTYEKVYGKNQDIKYDYVHGRVNRSEKLSNNMVLGIDEYLTDDRKDTDTDFIDFKKYYQRIYKGTGCKYKEWVERITESWENETEENKAEIRKCISSGDLKNNKIHNLYIFGHSLDDTDKDVLRDLILNDNVHTTIFYHNKEELGRKIANLVKVIGQDELIRRTGGSTRTIEFKEQQEMVDINA